MIPKYQSGGGRGNGLWLRFIFGTSGPWLIRQAGGDSQVYQISSNTWPTEMEYLNENRPEVRKCGGKYIS